MPDVRLQLETGVPVYAEANGRTRDNRPIDVENILSAIREHLVWLVVPILVASVGGLVVTRFQEPRYEATVTLLAGQGEGIADVTAIDAITKATQTLASMGTDPVVIEQALEESGLNDEVSVDSVARRTTSNVPLNTQEIEITVQDGDAKRAARLANAIGDAFSTMVDERAGKESKLSATVWQPARSPSQPVSPSVKMNIALGFLVGLATGAISVFVRSRISNTWRDEARLEAIFDAPILASIPDATSISGVRVYR